MWYIAGIPVVGRNYGLVVSGFLFTSVAVLAVLLRVFTRVFLVKNVGIDDCFIAASMFGAIAFLTAVVHQIKYGLGNAVDPSIIQDFLKSLLATVVAYSFTHLAVKFSILFQCKRIFVEKSAQRIFLGLLIWMTAYGLFCFWSSIITCVPVAKYWDDSIPGGCIDRSNLHYALAGFNIVNDIALLVAPIPYLKNLQIPRKAKMVLIAVFACGGFACIVAIIRLHSLYVNNSAPINEQPIKGVDIALWSGLEINVAIICACVPALKPLFVKFFPRLISSLGGDSAKRSRTGRSTQGSLPLRSFDHRNHYERERKQPGIEIQVRQSFEMKTMATDGDNDSEKNLVTGHEGWKTECYADGANTRVPSTDRHEAPTV